MAIDRYTLDCPADRFEGGEWVLADDIEFFLKELFQAMADGDVTAIEALREEASETFILE